MPLKTLPIVAVLLIATACSTSEDPSNPSPIASVAAIQPELTSTQPPTSTTTPSVVPLPTAVVTPTTTPIPARVLPTLTPLPIATPLPTGTIPLITTEPAFPGLHFATFGDNTVLLTYPPDGTNRVAVVEQDGLVKIFENSASVSQVSTFLDIQSQVARNGDEEGLLGLVFHPNHVVNGYFYVYYSSSNPRRSIISRFTTFSGDRNRADPTSELKILEIPQPNSNHNGGMIEFGPDGYLYIALGDGGSSGDPYRNGQNPSTLLGSILRIDVDNPSDSDNLNYSIPPDNPFANSPGNERPEIWAYGLRNPWRFSFDRGSGDLWVGDVGQNTWEEVDVVVKGGNYGWNTLEASHCFSPASGCDSADTILPVVEHTNGGGNCSVTGGYVYRGPSIPELTGVYIYSDFCSGTLWGIRSNDREAGAQVIGGGIQWVASFGEDEMGNLYMLGFGSPIRRITLSN
jgi:glucose/arabinose dehydrogenase